MKTATLTIPQLMAVIGTRAMLGAGIGLLVADRLAPGRRKTVGGLLAAIGVVTTPFLARNVLFPNLKEEQEAPPAREPVVASP
jgi:hypothetical protein